MQSMYEDEGFYGMENSAIRHKTVLEKGAKDQRCKLGPVKGAVNNDNSHTATLNYICIKAIHNLLLPT